ncbi:polycystic kidney disease and receptor for egg jelly-related protein-like isoform X3 [Lagopus muta]|uniref:polycystic kidney disease and receptor for egg jelly-related protein-like isoform X1 n=1 Tax=Lagopus muta TaxID=64668 RepID=UPI00209D7299|nr:polycystic kidney disease and receptor for egg jelly-related protein-like isoform X1 [Lagopus muta]XP_048808304.1 polycystic kidney disease and receptor for egg jelly-related protein-like isoform X3 [Lagopus muta]
MPTLSLARRAAMPTLLFLLQLLAFSLLALRACSPRVQPPPLAVSCLGAPGRGSAGRSGEGWLSCLGNGTLRLRYRPAPGATAEAESTERQPASPPHCRWYLNWGWVKNTSLWSGQFTLQSGLSLGSALWPVASSLITVQSSSASCAAPECLYRNLSVKMSARWAAQKSSHAYRDGTRSATCLFHCSAFPGDPEKHQGFVAKVSITRNGLTPALPSVRDDTSKATELAVLHQEAACKFNSVTIQKPSLHTSVIRQKKGKTFELYARVLVDCNLHVSIKPQWIFYAVKDMKTNPDWDQPLNTSAMHGVNTVQLTVPSWTLDYGMYQVYFTASVYMLGTKRSFNNTDRVFIKIERSDLVASIAGGNFRTVGFFDNWTLDGSVSYDPDSPERLKGLTFTWYCTKKLLDYESMRISAGNKCHPAQRDLRWLTSSGAVQVLAPESLPGNTVYHFRLVIQKDRRQSYADQSVNVQSGFSPLLDVACLENCGSAVIPTERFTLSGKCLNCQTSSQPVHHSSLWMENSTEISFDWSSRTSTASVLNYTEAAPTLPIPKAQLRESLLKAALNISVESTMDGCLVDTCRLGSLTNWQRVHCVCSMKQSHRSRSVLTASNTSTFDIKFLAAKVIVTPNRVDLKGNLIADIPKNPVTLLTVLFIFSAYFLLSLWAVRKDRAEMVSKDKIIVLPDNDPFDKVSFLVTLYTGSRWGAGTSADVFLQLIGQNGTSDVHCLRHPQFPAFRRGSTDCFLLTTKEDLGDICAFRVWHNNRGPSPGWFLSRAKVEHVSARKTWFFMCRKWLALDKGDGLLERTFSVTNPKAPLSRKDYFLIDLARGLKEGHLWLSVFAQVLTGTYSRLQRLSSCLTTLLLKLFVNIMFFNADRDEESPRHLRYLRSIAIGIEYTLIAVPVEMIIMALFKYSQKNPERSLTLLPGNLKTWRVHSQKRKRSETSAQSGSISSPENVPAHSDSQGPTHNLKRRTEGKTRSQGAPQDSSNCQVSEGGASTAGDKEQTGKNSRPKVKARRRRLPSNSNFSNNCAKEAGNLQEESKLLSVSSVPFCKRPPIVCWWWCVYLSWVLVITVSGVSSFFIVLYGLSYGYQTSLEWLLASATSFIQNVFFVSIIKISCYSALKTVRPKYCENIPWSTQDLSSEIKAEKEAMNEEEMREKHFKLAQIRDTEQYKPLKDGEIAKMLETAKIKAKAFIFIKDVIGHLVVLAVVLCLAYSTENTISFHYNQFIRNQFSPRLPAVVKLADIYTWVNDTFLPLIHNDVQPTFLTDSSSKIIGLPRMRQVRAKGTEKTCFHPHSFVNKFVISKSHCLHKYGRDLEEKGDYAGTWTKVANRSFSKETSSYPGFTYQPNWAPWTYFSYGDLHTYGPGGYTFYFFPEEGRHNSTTRLHLLQESNWFDEKTWAVIIELTTFTSDGDLFCSISVIFELSDFGIIKPTLSVHSFAVPIFHQQTKGRQLFFLAAVAFLLLYIADGLYSMVQGKKNTKTISRTISFILKWAFFLIVPFQVLKFKMGADIVHFFLLYPNDFIPFHAVSHLDQNLRNTLGFLAFLAVLKTLKYSQLFYEVRLAQRSILAALPGISSMASVVVVYFSIFMAFGYLVFGQHEWNYNNMIHSAQTVFSYCVSAFRDTAFSSSRLLGGFFLTSFLLVMTCVLINLFQAVIMSAYGDRKQLVYEEPPDEARAVAFLLQRMKKMLCFPICRTAKRSDPNLCHGVPNGQAEKRVQ